MIAQPVGDFVQHCQAVAGARRHRHRHRPVEGHHGVRRQGFQHVVEPSGLSPVGGGGLGVDGGDGRRGHILADRTTTRHVGHQAHPLGHELAIPAAANLVGEGNEMALVIGPGLTAGIGEDHEGQQRSHLLLLGEGGVDLADQADGFAGEVGAGQGGSTAGGVALVEQQVQGVQDQWEALALLLRCGPGEGFLRGPHRGCSGRPSVGHVPAAATSASCTASSASAKAVAAKDPAEDLRRQLTQQVLDGRSGGHFTGRGRGRS